MILIALLSATLLAGTGASTGRDTGSVGLSMFTTIDTQHGDTIHAALWYPSSDRPRDTTLRLQPLHVAPNGALAYSAAPRPAIIISHGTGGDEMGHWDTAESLARAGFIVITIRHPGDNSRDHSGLGTDRYLYGRSAQIKVLLDAILADHVWRTRIDTSRIGALGYSVGGLTVLELFGGRPDPKRLGTYCIAHPVDPLYCASDLHGQFTLTGQYTAPTSDHRIRSAVLLAPAWSFLFDRAGLAKVTAPLLIERASLDSVVIEPDNVEHIVAILPTKPTTGVINGAIHYSFLAPCSAALARAVPEICADSPGFSRTSMHANLNANIVRFFERTLAVGVTTATR
ncbi:MAG: dienelactone hydrolase [Gemmatimonadaceae bacterium]